MSRTEGEIAEVVEIIPARGGRGRIMICDVADAAQIQRRFAEIDRLDVLVNNAGIAPGPSHSSN